MKHITIFVAIALFLVSVPALAQQSIILAVREGDIKVYYGEKTVYLVGLDQKAEYDPSWWGGSLFLVEFMGVRADNNKFVRIDNVTHTVQFASSNQKVLQFERGNVNSLNGVFNIWKPGTATVSISVEGHTSTIPIQVVKLPVHIGMVAKEIIKAIGIPTTRVKSPSTQQTEHQIGKKRFSVSAETWTYKQYPGLLLIVDPISGLSGWRMVAWDKVDAKLGT